MLLLQAWLVFPALLAATLIIVGIQVFFSSFLLSILGLRRRPEGTPVPPVRPTSH